MRLSAAFAMRDHALGSRTHMVVLEGELDSAAAAALEQRLLEAVAAGSTAIVVDLGGVTFIDAPVVTVLLLAHIRLTRTGHGRFLIVCSDPVVQRIFELTGLAGEFELLPTRAEALTALERATPVPVPLEERS